MQPAVFAFPCATLITMILALIMYVSLRNAHQKDMVEVSAQEGGAGPLGPEREMQRVYGEGMRARPESLEGLRMSAQGPGAAEMCLRGKIIELASSHLTYLLCSAFAWKLCP